MRRNTYTLAKREAERAAQRASLTVEQRAQTTPQGESAVQAAGIVTSSGAVRRLWMLGISGLGVDTYLG